MKALSLSLKGKVLLSFLCIALFAVSACVYGICRFYVLRQQMQAVNEEYVPALKALSQIESRLFLLESDLDKSLQEGILRPRDGQVLQTHLEALDRFASSLGEDSFGLRARVESLIGAHRSLMLALDRIYANWAQREAQLPDLSAARNQFRFELKALSHDMEKEIRVATLQVQSDISRSGIVVSALLGLCLLFAFLLAYWIARSLRPLGILAKKMRRLSDKGLGGAEFKEIAVPAMGEDEIALLSREFNKMASSLLDQAKQLGTQKKNLESAHLEMAKQNVALRKARGALAHSEKLSLVGRLSAQMAHEIRNPLHALGLHLELLEEQLRRGSAGSIAPIRREVDRLMNVSKSYLDLAKAPKIETSPLQVNDLVEELQEFYGPLFAEKKIRLVCDLGNIPEAAVDRAQFSQVLGNLLKNAMEALESVREEKGKMVRVVTSFQREKNHILLRVEDNGVGIAKESQGSVFTPFYTSKAEGTGLGLAFSKQVIESHGGEISFESEKNAGTRFTLSLPVLH